MSSTSTIKLHAKTYLICDHRSLISKLGEQYAEHVRVAPEYRPWREPWFPHTINVSSSSETLDLKALEEGWRQKNTNNCPQCQTKDDVIVSAEYSVLPLEAVSNTKCGTILEPTDSMLPYRNLSYPMSFEAVTTAKSVALKNIEKLCWQNANSGVLSWVKNAKGQYEPVTAINFGEESYWPIAWTYKSVPFGKTWPTVKQTIHRQDGSELFSRWWEVGARVGDSTLSSEDVGGAVALLLGEEAEQSWSVWRKEEDESSDVA